MAHKRVSCFKFVSIEVMLLISLRSCVICVSVSLSVCALVLTYCMRAGLWREGNRDPGPRAPGKALRPLWGARWLAGPALCAPVALHACVLSVPSFASVKPSLRLPMTHAEFKNLP